MTDKVFEIAIGIGLEIVFPMAYTTIPIPIAILIPMVVAHPH
jgi:hypothetical protein